ncbi:hypothetical protein RND71_025476 [Anisodus tanguticus]|uniref:ABC transporter domain-containing protein n=1 Tax=Anisodus tanguticus TaxID=243964 RepID=A0AAE1RRU3_9SOLA|nr:hypothetical protein RND71_025476 [Anisodus tanguticus]
MDGMEIQVTSGDIEKGAMHNQGVAYLVWEDLTVMLPNFGHGPTKKLLHGLSGHAEPGRIMAIMGPSGSGKSTLLDTLAGRLSTNVVMTGNILLNGKKRRLDYGVVHDERRGKRHCGGDNNGNGARGLCIALEILEISGGEKKRLSIALEILARPRILFLDEPTTGLDSASAFFVVQALKNISSDGRTVISSIHQPSSEVFALFDDLFLLSGGETVYFGEAKLAVQHSAYATRAKSRMREPLATIHHGYTSNNKAMAGGVQPIQRAHFRWRRSMRFQRAHLGQEVQIAYVTQEDILMGTLTVRETIQYSPQLRLSSNMTKKEVNLIVENVISEMGLEVCEENLIENLICEDILSIALEIITQPQLLFLDEPTSGLDGASAYFVVQVLKNIACGGSGRTIICSIHQPSSEVFALFDDLFLLSSGETIYFGEAKLAVEFFGDSGFACPTRRNPADHFLRCINSDFDDVTGTLINKDVVIKGSGGSQSRWFNQLYTLIKRSLKNMSRDFGYYWLRIIVYIILSICVGTVLYDFGTGHNAIIARGACAGFISGFPSFIEEMKYCLKA